MKYKVFGVGFHKTGTSSLGRALRRLGYRVCGPVGVSRNDISSVAKRLAFEKIEEYDAFQDNPWPVLYKELDEHCEKSKFILTIREREEWIESIVSHFGGTSTPMRKWIYGEGDPLGNEKIYLDEYRSHNKKVKEYFQGRPGDLLTLRVTDGEGWDKLCSFLDHPVPGDPFPHHRSVASRRLGKLYQYSPAWLKKIERSIL